MRNDETRVDQVILGIVRKSWLKVAMVIAQSLDELSLAPTDESCEMVAQRIRALVESGRIEAQGDINHWRHSEVRQPSS